MRRKGIYIAALICILALLLSGCSEGNELISGAEDVNKSSFKLGVATGAHSQLEAEEYFPDCDMQYFTSVADGCAAVKAGKLDGFMFDKVYLSELCRTESELTMIDEEYVGSDVAFGLAKGNEALMERMNTVIAQLNEDGTLSDMLRRWIDGDDRTMPELEKPADTSDTLIMLTPGTAVPFAYIADDGVCIGMEVELGMRIAYALGMDFEVRIMNFDAILPTIMSESGNFVANGLSMTEERKQKMLFTDPYYQSTSTVLVRKDRYKSSNASLSFDLTDEELNNRLKSARLGTLSGSTSEKQVRIDYPDAEVYDFATVPDVLAALQAGKIDYAVVQEIQARIALKAINCRYCTNPVYIDPGSFVVAKGNDELLDKINSVIKTLSEDGTLQSAFESWANGDYSMDDVPECTEGDVLRVAVNTTAEPMRFLYNDEIIGYDCEIIERIAYALGMRVEYLDVPFATSIATVVGGKADVAVALTYTEERAQQVLFSDPYCTINISMIERIDDASNEGNLLEELKSSFIGTFITESRWKLFLSGVGVTATVSVGAYLLSTLLGLLLCAMQHSRLAPLRGFASAYCKVITGIPTLVWLMILYYMVFKSVDIPAICIAIIGFGLVSGAGLSGIFCTGFDSVDKGQIEAASALGFMPRDIFRRIIFPQAAARVFDLYKGQFVTLTKATSVVGYIAIMDLTKVSDIVRSRTYQAFFPLITTALIYFGITCLFLTLLGMLQRKLNPRLRRHVLKGIKTR